MRGGGDLVPSPPSFLAILSSGRHLYPFSDITRQRLPIGTPVDPSCFPISHLVLCHATYLTHLDPISNTSDARQ